MSKEMSEKMKKFMEKTTKNRYQESIDAENGSIIQEKKEYFLFFIFSKKNKKDLMYLLIDFVLVSIITSLSFLPYFKENLIVFRVLLILSFFIYFIVFIVQSYKNYKK